MKVYLIGGYDSPEERRISDVAATMEDAVKKARAMADGIDWMLQEGEVIITTLIEKDFYAEDMQVSFVGNQGTRISFFVREAETDLCE